MKIVSVSIDAVHLDPANARKHNKKNLDAIRGSIENFGTVEPLVVQKSTGKIIGGNGRYAVLKELGRKTVDVVYLDIDDVKATALGLALNRTSELAEWDDTFLDKALKSLHEFQFDLSGIGFDQVFVKGHIRSDSDLEDEESYTKKIKSPIYEPKGTKPSINQLFDATKTTKMIQEIIESNVSSEEKSFLVQAASRHTVFSYEHIAEYYAQASKETQELMEKSALVIIDFDKAIENGFMNLSKNIAEAYSNA